MRKDEAEAVRWETRLNVLLSLIKIGLINEYLVEQARVDRCNLICVLV